MKKKIFPGFVFFAFVIGCKSNSKRNLQPEIATTDSAVVMYYRAPGNPRFFSMVKVYEKEIISKLNDDINGSVIPPKDTCTTQGKIYFYGEHGAVYVAYFSRLKDCMSISFIKTGEKYFTKMSETTKDLLDELQKNAKEPITQ
ncbi:MAG TPA: hypothetical protein VF144_18765 [Chitinophagaceae bacterium]